MSEPALLYRVEDEIAYLTMNRPEKRNAINPEMSLAIRDAWDRMQADDSVKVAIISGAGESFCGGADISPRDEHPEIPSAVFQSHLAFARNGEKIFKPIIAAVQGNAAGAGFAVAVKHADFTIAADDAVFSFPEGRVGIPIPPLEYKPYLPFKISLELTILGWKGARPLSAKRAHDLGIVNEVVPRADLMSEAKRWAEMLKQVPPLYIKSIKKGHYEATRAQSYTAEWEYMDFIWPQLRSADRQEGLRAFAEKRAPKFTGK